MKRQVRLEDLDRAFHDAMREMIKTSFPNPERKGCPPAPTLLALAKKTLPLSDPAIDHVGECSPCFNEVEQLRSSLRRKRIARSSTAAAAAVLLAITLSYFALRAPDPLIDDTPVIAVLDLRDRSPLRGAAPEPTTADRLTLPRRVLDMTIQLPIGSFEGTYDVEIREDGEALSTATGEATIENGITALPMRIDTREIPEGAYDLVTRQGDFTPRVYPLRIE
jgi:hypothetical protein